MTRLEMTPEDFRRRLQALHEELSRIVVGQQDVVERLLIAFFAGGHVLFEGVPGLGKTLLAKSFAQALGLTFKRIQCTPDLMPADILGTQLVVERDGRKVFEFSRGPVFTHILLADEINRATPKTQSALLEAMEEHQVSISGSTHRLEEPFFVMATQNPIEMEGSLPLDETVFVNGALVSGSELLKQAVRTGIPMHAKNGAALYDVPGWWTWTLNAQGAFEEQPCQLYTLPYSGELLHLKTKTGREIRVTADHPFLINRSGEIVWKLAKELQCGDFLVSPSTLPSPPPRKALLTHEEVLKRLEKRYRVVRHEELLAIMAQSDGFRKAHILSAGAWNKLRIASRLTKRQLAQELGLSKRGYWQLVRFFERNTANAPLKEALRRYFSLHPIPLLPACDFIESYTITSLRRFEVTAEVAAWLAFLLSDGAVGQNVVAAYQKHYPEALEAFIRTTREQIGVDISAIRQQPGGRTVWIRSKPLVDYLRLRFGLTRSGVIPSWMLSWPQELLRSFLRTFISLESHCDTARRRITFIQKRRQAVNVIMHMLLREGILSWVHKRPTVYALKVQGEDYQKFFRQVGWIDGRPAGISRPSDPMNGYSPFRVVPVAPQHLRRLCGLLGIASFHRAKARRAIASRPWYNACRYGTLTGIVSHAKLRQFLDDMREEIALRKHENIADLVSADPRKAARLCGLSLTDIAQTLRVSKNRVWKTYCAPITSPSPMLSTYVTHAFHHRVAEAERLTDGLERLSRLHYDAVEDIKRTSGTGPVFGLTVPSYRNYLAGFGACGVSHNTFPLPEAQLDRFFFKIIVRYPSPTDLSQIIRQTTAPDLAMVRPVLPPEGAREWILQARRLVREVLVASTVEDYVVRLVSATHPTEGGAEAPANQWLRYGVSPRGAQAILLGAKVSALMAGRVNVSFEDVDRVLLPALSHRVVLSFEAEAEKRTASDIVTLLTAPVRAR